MHRKRGDFSSILWCLLLPLLLLCNSPSTVYRLGYNEVLIIASPSLQTAKELLPLNFSTLDNIISFNLNSSPSVWVNGIGPTTWVTYWNPLSDLCLYKFHILVSLIHIPQLLPVTSLDKALWYPISFPPSTTYIPRLCPYSLSPIQSR